MSAITVKTQAELDAFLLGLRLGQHIAKEDGGCWTWTGHRDASGYGRAFNGTSADEAHRLVFENVHGPTSLPLDHLCRNRACVNPSHLEPVTQAENNGRAASVQSHCRNGHEYSAENTLTDPHGWRRCRACNRARCQRRRAQGLAVAA